MKKKNIVKAVKILQANSKALKEFQKTKYVNNEGNAVIDIYVNKDNMYDIYSNPKDFKLSNGIYEYIDDEIKNIPLIYPLEICIHSEEDFPFENKLKEYYWERIAKLNSDLKKSKLTDLILFILGILLYVFYFSFIYIWPNQILFNEIFSVAATFLIWESVDFYLIQSNVIKIDYLKGSRLAIAKINQSKE